MSRLRLLDFDGSGTSRRQFVQRGATVGGVLAAGAWLPGCGGDGDGDNADAEPAGAPAGRVVRGGTLRYGSSGSTQPPPLDAHNQGGAGRINLARASMTWEGLAYYEDDSTIQMALAEEITAEAADVWVIRLRPDVEFHNGKTLDIDDVIFSLRRILGHGKQEGVGRQANSIITIDTDNMKKLDNLTVRLTLKQPDATLLEGFGLFEQSIVPVGYDGPESELAVVGTGPYVLESNAGSSSVHTRFANYREDGIPYLDRVEITNITDATARVNALLSGQVDLVDSIADSQASAIERRDGFELYAPPGKDSNTFNAIIMRVDTPPYDDPDVRLALKLLADRPQMVEQAVGRSGAVTTDVFPSTCGDFPAREYDPEQAKSLLAKAGHANLKIDMPVTDFGTGQVGFSQIYAENAKAAGVTVNVEEFPEDAFLAQYYLKTPFTVTNRSGKTYLQQVALLTLPDGASNETHQDFEDYNKMFLEARAELDEAKRCEIIQEMRQIEFDRGGYLNVARVAQIGAHVDKFTGFKPDQGIQPLNQYGHGFRRIHMT